MDPARDYDLAGRRTRSPIRRSCTAGCGPSVPSIASPASTPSSTRSQTTTMSRTRSATWPRSPARRARARGAGAGRAVHGSAGAHRVPVAAAKRRSRPGPSPRWTRSSPPWPTSWSTTSPAGVGPTSTMPWPRRCRPSHDRHHARRPAGGPRAVQGVVRRDGGGDGEPGPGLASRERGTLHAYVLDHVDRRRGLSRPVSSCRKTSAGARPGRGRPRHDDAGEILGVVISVVVGRQRATTSLITNASSVIERPRCWPPSPTTSAWSTPWSREPRFDAVPASGFFRTKTHVPVTLHDETIPADAKVACSSPRVGRPRRGPAFDAPDESASTGGGRVGRHLRLRCRVHYCLGAPALARFEARHACRAAHRSAAGSAPTARPDGSPRYSCGPASRCPSGLGPLRFGSWTRPGSRLRAVTPAETVRSFIAAIEARDLDRALASAPTTSSTTTCPSAGSTARTPCAPRWAVPRRRQRGRVGRPPPSGRGARRFNERNDRFHLPNGWIDLPVNGVWEVHDGRITLWRDYFDEVEFRRQAAAAT